MMEVLLVIYATVWFSSEKMKKISYIYLGNRIGSIWAQKCHRKLGNSWNMIINSLKSGIVREVYAYDSISAAATSIARHPV